METKFTTILKNVAYCIHMDTKVVVVVHNQVNPTDEEWYEHYIPDTLGFAKMGIANQVLIYSDGGSPSSEQRKALDKYYSVLDNNGQTLKIALVSKVPYAVRIAVMVLNVFFAKNRLRMFDSINTATDWLGLLPEKHAGISEVVDNLRKELEKSACSG